MGSMFNRYFKFDNIMLTIRLALSIVIRLKFIIIMMYTIHYNLYLFNSILKRLLQP